MVVIMPLHQVTSNYMILTFESINPINLVPNSLLGHQDSLTLIMFKPLQYFFSKLSC